MISLEHGQSVRTLLEDEKVISAFGLLRIQYETLVRALWVLHAAPESSISRISDVLTLENEKKANSLPMLSEMLAQLEGKAPSEPVRMMNEFKVSLWKPLSSFIHAGIHPINLYSSGVPFILMADFIKVSNGLSTLSGVLVSTLCENIEAIEILATIRDEFADCLPKLIVKTSQSD